MRGGRLQSVAMMMSVRAQLCCGFGMRCKSISQAVCHMLLQHPFEFMPNIPSCLYVLKLVFFQHYRYEGPQH